MSRREEYLAQEARTRALAERIGDPLSRETLRQAADSWRLLAEMETVGAPKDAERSAFRSHDA